MTLLQIMAIAPFLKGWLSFRYYFSTVNCFLSIELQKFNLQVFYHFVKLFALFVADRVILGGVAQCDHDVHNFALGQV